ncbi:MAG: sigma-70 family RNA polymerase sigma factor, partial [Planctomycetes bacterium]|nr:sigma-70 family RNA polymerase sigma factor [Planctomycetota bacterium]
MSDVTQILSAIEGGDAQAVEQLLPLVYQELRKLAAQRMARESPDHTLQATALVHEAYIRLVDVEKAQHWDSRGHFFAAAAEAMRRILIDGARRKQSDRHGGQRQQFELLEGDLLAMPLNDELLDLDEALTKLEKSEQQIAELVKLRTFAGRNFDEVAAQRGVSVPTA